MPFSNNVTNFINGTLNGGQLGVGVVPGRAAQSAMSPDASSVFTDWLYPANKEYRQMAEQLLMDEFSPQSKMKGLIDAGINPLTAASAVAGASPSSPQPSASVNPAGDVAGAVGAVAGAGDSVSSAVSTLKKLDPEISELNSRARVNLSQAGLDDANINAVMTDNKYRGENWEAELALKRQNFKNMQQELSIMKARHREILSHCDEMISQIELNGSQKDYYDAMQLKISEDLRWQKELNDWRISNNLHITESGVDGYSWNLLYNEAPQGDVDAFFDSYYEYCKFRSEAVNRGRYSAEAEFANQISFARKNGENASNVVYNTYGNFWNFVGSLQNSLSRDFRKLNTDIDTFASHDDASNIRRSLTDALNSLYDQMNADPTQTPALRKKIMELHSVLQLSNSELLDYVKRKN